MPISWACFPTDSLNLALNKPKTLTEQRGDEDEFVPAGDEGRESRAVEFGVRNIYEADADVEVRLSDVNVVDAGEDVDEFHVFDG